ncbi:MAG: ABC transporter permease [Candidatus Magasanikbacteria bacterium]|nr:ABC transporter permease [Candidatus Magasanikbacteria bacterium]
MNLIGLHTFVAKEISRFLRVFIQSLVSPWINAFLYIFIFGVVVGTRIDTIAGVKYIDFVLPGILMMNLISASFSQSSSSLYFQRFARHIEEILVSPLSYVEMVVGYVVGALARALVVGIGVYVIAIIFSAATMAHVLLFLFYSIAISIMFALVGLIIGLWADNFEQLFIFNTFVITPLIFLGGMFNSVTMLPENIQTIARLNPFFYFVDGLRYSMIGIRESNPWVGFGIIVILLVSLLIIVWILFKRGWRIRT